MAIIWYWKAIILFVPILNQEEIFKLSFVLRLLVTLAVFNFLDLSIVLHFNDINIYSPKKNKQFFPSPIHIKDLCQAK